MTRVITKIERVKNLRNDLEDYSGIDLSLEDSKKIINLCVKYEGLAATLFNIYNNECLSKLYKNEYDKMENQLYNLINKFNENYKKYNLRMYSVAGWVSLEIINPLTNRRIRSIYLG